MHCTSYAQRAMPKSKKPEGGEEGEEEEESDLDEEEEDEDEDEEGEGLKHGEGLTPWQDGCSIWRALRRQGAMRHSSPRSRGEASAGYSKEDYDAEVQLAASKHPRVLIALPHSHFLSDSRYLYHSRSLPLHISPTPTPNPHPLHPTLYPLHPRYKSSPQKPSQKPSSSWRTPSSYTHAAW